MDESALGLGKLLASTRDDVIFAGHPDLQEIPLGTIDVGWMPIVAERNLVIRHWQALEDRREELGPGPWSVTLLGGGLSPRVWRPEA